MSFLVRSRHLLLGFFTANAAAALSFYGCDLQSGGTGGGVGPLEDGGFDSAPDAPPVCQVGDPACTDAGRTCDQHRSDPECQPVLISAINGATDLALDNGVGVAVSVLGSPSNSAGQIYYVQPVQPYPDGGPAPATVLATGQAQPRGPSVDGTSIYWATAKDPVGFFKVAKGGGSSPAAITGDLPAGVSTLVRNQQLYWVNEDAVVKRISINGGTEQTVATPQGSTSPSPSGHSLITDGTNLFWLADRSGVIYRAPVDGSGGTAEQVVSGIPSAGSSTAPTSLVLQDNDLYVAVRGDKDSGGGLYHAVKSSTAGDVPQIWSQKLTDPSLAVDKDYLYYTDKGSLPPGAPAAVYRLPRTVTADADAGTPTPFALDPQGPVAIAVDATYIYWVNSKGLVRMPK